MSPMRLDMPTALRPKRRDWFVAFAGIALGCLIVFVVLDMLFGWSPGNMAGLVSSGAWRRR